MNPVDDISNYKYGIFYYNAQDPRTILPKRLKAMGYQLNFAKPLSYLIVIAFIVFATYLVIFLS